MSTPVLDRQSGETIREGMNGRGLAYNSAPADFEPVPILPEGFLDFLLPLHHEFTARQQELVARRAAVLSAAHRGDKPEHLPPSAATTTEWQIALPSWCKDQRNQMTGPADDA
ncbi:MAG TPA: hypothetical protein VN920_13540, partial [Pyrinomonadaceae bacterium]|nr:hypothetical protein [Pyrinomonadaceae bacterium]